MMNMNWIILIIAGLCEVGFTYCLGRAKGVAGYEWWTCAKMMETKTAVTTPTVSNPHHPPYGVISIFSIHKTHKETLK
jgi:hypothetical protein